MDSVVVKETLIEQINNLSSLNTIIETILVDNSVGNFDLIKTVKEGEKIINISDKIFYKLKSTRLLIKSDKDFKNSIIISDIDDQIITNNKPLCECVARNTNIIFAKEFNRLKSTEHNSMKFWNESFFSKLFSPSKEKRLESIILEMSKGFSWIIIPRSITKFFEKNTNFEKNSVECENLIHLFGKFHCLNVFVNPDQKEQKIYFGNFESLILIINKNLELKENKTISNTFINSTSMTVEYSIIEKSPIRSLELL